MRRKTVLRKNSKQQKAFQRFSIRLGMLLTAVLGIVLTIIWHNAFAMIPVKEFFPTNKVNAVWEWQNPQNASPVSLSEKATFLRQHQINLVYLDVSSLAAKGVYEDQKAMLVAGYQNYIAAMSAQGIRVFASGGDASWSKPEVRQYPVALMEAVFMYNQNNPNQQFTGIEYDIESYNQEGFAEAGEMQKEAVLTEYLDTIDTLASKLQASGQASELELGFAVPYWFDNQNKNIPPVTWQDKRGPTIYHVMDRLNQLPNANVVVMAYRNAARGNDGSIALSRLEIQYSQYKAPNVKVIIGQETTQVEPVKITFYGKTLTELSQEVQWTDDEYGKNPSYGGIAINDVVGYMALPEK